MLPDAAEPETTLEFDEDTVLAERGPVRLFKACASLSRFVASGWSVSRAVIWF